MKPESSETRMAVLLEREECARIMCWMCGDAYDSGKADMTKVYPAYLSQDGHWYHRRIIPWKDNPEIIEACHATAIRERK